MAVLIEAISVVVKLESLRQLSSARSGEFDLRIPNRSYCQDQYLLRVGFMNGADVTSYLNYLEGLGLTAGQSDSDGDFAVVDQIQGPIRPCAWLRFHKFNPVDEPGSILGAALSTDSDHHLSTPAGWKYQGSISQSSSHSSPQDFADRMVLLRTEGNVEVYLDRATGKEVHVGRVRE